jgi:hypothetical protein
MHHHDPNICGAARQSDQGKVLHSIRQLATCCVLVHDFVVKGTGYLEFNTILTIMQNLFLPANPLLNDLPSFFFSAGMGRLVHVECGLQSDLSFL